MKVNDFYKARKCKKMLELGKQMENANKRPLILSGLMRDMCHMFENQSSEKEIKEHILTKLKEYEDSWFAYSWQKPATQNLDFMVLVRFLNWWKENFSDCLILEDNKELSVTVGTQLLETHIHLIVEKGGRYIGIRLSYSAHKKSMNGRSMRTNSVTDLNNMVAKAALEETYPGIVMYDISMRNGDDTSEGISRNFTQGSSAACNVHVIGYDAYYEDSVFQADVFKKKMLDAAEEKESVSCYGCDYETLCQQEKAELSIAEKAEAYVLPSFTEEQSEVISFTEGCMSVIAGPGSGKTATLVGRIYRLIEQEKIPSDFILVLSFSKEAVKELKNRCESLLPAWKQPKISTVNALAYEILMRNTRAFDTGYELLTEDKEMALVETLTKVFDRISGVNYNVIKGKNGVVSQLVRRLHAYKENPDGFFDKYPEMGEDFVAFYKEYESVIKARNYIDFASQITLATKHLKENGGVASAYQSMFRYIMVDEYQDINEPQHELITLLAGDKPNLVVVGDDDQGIYRFLGGDAKYLRSFSRLYHAECVKLTENFRSSVQIVDAAAKVISGSPERIEKEITAQKEGVLPTVFVSGRSDKEWIDTIKGVVTKIVSDGISYGDIAMLSYSNKALGTVQRCLAGEIPMRLSKTYLKDDFLFSYLYAVLALFYENGDVSSEKAFLAGRWNTDATREELLHRYPYLKTVTNAVSIVNLVSENLDAFDTVSRSDLLEFISEWKLYNVKDLYEKMEYMKRYEDTTRASVPKVDKITLSTCHDAKGREWKAVILLDGEVYNNKEESDKNLLYVAVTRAKDVLYVICKGKDTFSVFLE